MSFPVLADTYYVATTGDDNRSTLEATNPSTPWQTVSHASSSAEGDTIYVAPGVYTQTLIGLYNYNTYISTITGAATFEPSGASTDNEIMQISKATMEGFTLISHNLSNCLTIMNTAVDPSVRNNIFINEHTSRRGINIQSGATGASLEGNTIIANNGIADSGKDTTIIGNKIIAYDSSGDRGIFRSGTYSCLVRFNEIRGFTQTAPNTGTGIYLGGGDITIDKNTIVKNLRGIDSVTSYGNNATVESSIVAAEVGGYSGTGTIGIRKDTSGTITSQYNCLYANDSDYSGTILSQAGDIYLDPQFMDATNNDFNLKYFSPCIDAGTGEADTDGTRADMGAYPYYQSDFTGPTVTVLTPITGESVPVSSSYNVTWTATDPSLVLDNSVSLYYSSDNGANYFVLATGEANDGNYSWSTTTESTTAAKIRITARDITPRTNLGTGESGTFTVATTTTTTTTTTTVPGTTTTTTTTTTIKYPTMVVNLTAVASSTALAIDVTWEASHDPYGPGPTGIDFYVLFRGRKSSADVEVIDNFDSTIFDVAKWGNWVAIGSSFEAKQSDGKLNIKQIGSLVGDKDNVSAAGYYTTVSYEAKPRFIKISADVNIFNSSVSHNGKHDYLLAGPIVNAGNFDAFAFTWLGKNSTITLPGYLFGGENQDPMGIGTTSVPGDSGKISGILAGEGLSLFLDNKYLGLFINPKGSDLPHYFGFITLVATTAATVEVDFDNFYAGEYPVETVASLDASTRFYHDTDVIVGETYFYAVSPNSPSGKSGSNVAEAQITTTTTTTTTTTSTSTISTTTTTIPSGLSGFSKVSPVLRPGAALNIDFLSKETGNYTIFIFYQSTGVMVRDIPFNTTAGPNRVSWRPEAGALKINTGEPAPPGIYYYEIRSSNGTLVTWGNFVIGKWNQ